jgi:lysozyme
VSRNNSIQDISRLSIEITKEETIDVNKLEEISEKSLQPIIENPINYLTAKTSKVTRDSIKHHEKLRLTAYVVGKDDDTDKKITIGYGHAYPKNASPYNVGDEITLSEAEKLFLQDIHKSENGIKRMLSQWEKEGITIKLNQQMFDSMVSMAFNMGISGFMQTEFVKHLKKGDYKTAAEKIKTARVSSKFPGLTKRREQEHRMFVKNIIYK